MDKFFNLGSDEKISLKKLAELMVSLNKSGNYRIIPFPPERKAIDIGDYYSNWKLIHDKLGWIPRISLEDGLKNTIEFYRNHLEKYL